MSFDTSSGEVEAAPAIPGNVYSGVARCCPNDVLYVATDGWTGPPGMRLARSASGQWTGALAAMLRAIATHTGMELVFVEQDDCHNPLSTGGGLGSVNTAAFHCVRRVDNQTVALARFRSLWDGFQHGRELDDHGVYVTTSFMEVDSSALLHVRRKADYGIWQVFAPFDGDLWLAAVLTTLIVALILPSVLRDSETRKPLTGGGATGLLARPRVRLELLYHPISMVFGADDLEWTGNLSARLLRLGWMFFILISVSSYTANLASFFTAQSFEVLGPQDMTSLQSATACYPTHSNDEAHLDTHRTDMGVGSMMGGLITATMPDQFAGLTNAERAATLWSLW